MSRRSWGWSFDRERRAGEQEEKPRTRRKLFLGGRCPLFYGSFDAGEVRFRMKYGACEV
jgi:hypothetical protein